MSITRKLKELIYGRNWRTSKKNKGGAVNTTYPSPGGTATRTKTFNAGKITFKASTTAGKGTSVTKWYYVDEDGNLEELPLVFSCQGSPNVERKTPSGRWCPPWMAGELGEPNAAKFFVPHPQWDKMPKDEVPSSALPPTDMVAGEIICWRAWYFDRAVRRLRSIFVDYYWPIDDPAIGQPGMGYGLHGFKEWHNCRWEYNECIDDLVLGQCALWGDVIEYRHGYCGEYGKVLNLIAPKGIRDIYKVPKSNI